MAEKIELLISAKNAASSALKDARTDVRTLENQVRKATDELEKTGQGRREVERLTDSLGQARVEAKRWALVQKDAAQELDKVTGAAKRANRETDKLGRSQHKAGKGGSAMVAGWGKVAGVAAGVTAAIAGMAGAFSFLSDSVNEARNARKTAAQTAAVMKSMGRVESPKSIEKLINNLSRMAGIDDDEIRVLTNSMLTFGDITGENFDRANRAALDLSVAFGKDLQSSAIMVGKALNNPTKGLAALTRVGVSFTDQQIAQVKAMQAAGDTAGAQKIIMRELEKEVGGSAKAQADAIGRASVAWGNLKEGIGEVILSSGGGWNLTKVLEDATKWIKKHKKEISSVLIQIQSAVFKLISVWLKWQSIALKAFGYIIGGIASLLQAMAWLDPSMQGAADRAKGLADGFGQASEQANAASGYFDALSDRANVASRRTKDLADALKQIDGKKAKATVEVTLTQAWDAVNAATDSAYNPPKGRKKQDTGDTPTPRGRGLGHGLAAAHSMLNAGIPGRRTITSGLRWHNLGSPGSDHAHGRALDLTGPGLNEYARRVRSGGGFAQFHGSGPDRHLHAVPAGGAAEQHTHYHATINNPSSNVDIKATFRQMQLEAQADSRRRGAGRAF